MIVVSDSSPLIALSTTGHLGVLRDMYGMVLIPEAVRREVVEAGAGLPGASGVRDASWIESFPVVHDVGLQLLKQDLDEGEAEAIALAIERKADLVLLDETAARRRAAALGLSIVEAVGVLVAARAQERIPSLRSALDTLRASGFWLGEAVYNRALELAGESEAA